MVFVFQRWHVEETCGFSFINHFSLEQCTSVYIRIYLCMSGIVLE